MHFIRSVIATTLCLTAFVFAAPEPAHADDWVQCGTEKNDCVMRSNGTSVVRFGANGNYFFVHTAGVDRIPCTVKVFGDPAPGSGKHCDYTSMILPGVNDVACAQKNEICKPWERGARWVSTIAPSGGWFYKVGADQIPCDSSYFGIETTSTCFFRQNPIEAAGVFHDCATEGSPCPAGNGIDAYIVRYGTGQNWYYTKSTARELRCGNETFPDMAKGVTKFCQYEELPPSITDVVGSWHHIKSCFDCAKLEEAVTVGVTGTRANQVTNTWGEELAGSLELGRVGVIVTAKGTVSLKGSHSEAKSVTKTLSQQQTVQKTAGCQTVAGKKTSMYQWRYDVAEFCFAGSGTCSSLIEQDFIFCATGQPNDYHPICPPTTCEDSLCTKCSTLGID